VREVQALKDEIAALRKEVTGRKCRRSKPA
jgi:hypothetical protein